MYPGFCKSFYKSHICCLLLILFYFTKVKAEDIDAYAPKDLLIVTTGSQVRTF